LLGRKGSSAAGQDPDPKYRPQVICLWDSNNWGFLAVGKLPSALPVAYDVLVGNLYTNVTLRGPDQARVLVAVKALGYRAFVAATATELTVICEEQSDTQDKAIWLEVAKQLSEKLNCPALAVMNHDEDILSYALYRNGTLLDEYNFCPDYWGNADTPVPPRGGDAQALCETFGMPGNVVEVERILRTTTALRRRGRSCRGGVCIRVGTPFGTGQGA
jgi:hypothetical protein